MLCCVVFASTVAVLYRAWGWFARQRGADVPGFAAQAHWSAPIVDSREQARSASMDSRLPVIFCWLTLGLATYPAMVGAFWLMDLAPFAVNARHELVMIAGAGAAAGVFAVLYPHAKLAHSSAPPRIGAALVGIGGAWLTAGIVDMHVLSVLLAGNPDGHDSQHSHGGLQVDLAFHATGPILMLVGAIVLTVARRRPHRQPIDPRAAMADA